MRNKRARRLLAAASVPVIGLAATACQGPNSATESYVISSASGVAVTSLLTVGDGTTADNGYDMVGIPDGLGAQLDDNGQVVVNMNHELRATQGITRLHGQRGSFVSQYVINPANNRVTSGVDLIQPGVGYYDYLSGSFDDTAPAAGTRADGKVFPAYTNEFNRFCSGSLTKPFQLFNGRTGKGYLGQLSFANEESGAEGRVFAVQPDGTAKQLPRLGLFSWENTIAALNKTNTTLVMGNEDDAAGQLHAYVGRKVATGGATTRAGLQNGRQNVVTLDDGDPATTNPTTDVDFRAAYDKGTAVPFKLSDVEWNQSGADQNAEAATEGLSLNRIEDGAFDPSNPNDFYFVTTEGGEGTGDGGGGGLWKLSYTDIENPSLGGTLTLVLDGTESLHLNKPDNIDIDGNGNLLIQEDPGASDAVARVLAYRIADGATGQVATFDPNLFAAGSPNQITNDEESSGIIDASDTFGPGKWLLDAQVHTAVGLPPGNGPGTVEEYVEKGQLILMDVSDWTAVYGSAL